MIKKIMILLIVFILSIVVCSNLNAEPFAVWEPQLNILAYQVEVNGDVIDIQPNVVGDSMKCVYDLADIPIGANSLRARANAEFWGWSEWSEPWTIIRPGPPSNPQITTNP